MCPSSSRGWSCNRAFAFQIVASLLIVGALLLLTGPKYDAAPLLPERWPTERERLVKEGGGNAKSEEAVKRGLAWLAEQQKKDGSWEFDGVSKDKIAATGLALLPFLAAGEMDHPVRGGGIYRGEYQKCVAGGIKWLMSKMYADKSANQGGFFDTTSMYSQAIGTIALSEFAGRAHNPKAAAKAKLAVEFILRAQGRNGSWGYTGTQPSEGDTSIVGWQIEAIHAAERAGINVRNRDKAYQKASANSGERLIGFGLEVWLSGQGGNADALGRRSPEPVLHEGDESTASGVCSGGGLSQASAAAAEEQLRHVLLLLRDPSHVPSWRR